MYYLPVILACTSILFLSVLVYGILRKAPRTKPGDDNWRDKSPVWFRMSRPIVDLFVQQVRKSVRPYQLEILQDKLHSAGMGYTIRPEEFIVTRRIGFALAIVFFIYAYINLNIQETYKIVLMSLIIPLGYFYPDIWLRDTIKARKHQFDKNFPFFLDLLVLSMRAGLNFSSALSHAIEKIPEGPVRTEFRRILRDTRTGVSRRDALNHLAKRAQLPSVNNFVSAINQAEETGGELGTILLAQAEQRRSERFLKAEKLANQAPVKMLLPLIGFLFPLTFVIIVFPIYIKARDTGSLSFFQ